MNAGYPVRGYAVKIYPDAVPGMVAARMRDAVPADAYMEMGGVILTIAESKKNSL
jgi:hypothetical protein